MLSPLSLIHHSQIKSSEQEKINKEKQIKDNQDIRDCNLNNLPNSHYSAMEVQKTMEISDKQDFPKHKTQNYIGCLIGGSIGDALGWPVEFERLHSIHKYYGQNGITELQLVNDKAQITDDTQMTIFTADGLLKSAINDFNEDKNPDMNIIYDSYQNWLKTQYGHYSKNNNGWISNIKDLYSRRAPGTTCTGSLQKGIPGSIETHVNESKGCGGVMRVAPVGLMYYKNPEKAFEVGARCAALTHGSPSAYLPAGVHSCIIANLIQGKTIEEAVDNSIEILKKYSGHEDTLHLIEKAKEYAKSDISSTSAIYNLGEGWHGDEAIAISIYCVLKSPEDFEKALIMSVNHNGDSDSTGAIVGNILGTYLGEDKIPAKWKNSVELSSELRQLALDLYKKPKDIENSMEKYPTF